MNVGKRFVDAMEKVYGHARFGADLAREYEVSPQAISQYKNKRKATDLMREIAKDKGISLSWLEFGEGNMLVKGKDISMIQGGNGNIQTKGSKNRISGGIVSDSDKLYGEEEESVTLDYYPESYASAGGGAYPYLQKSKPMSFSKSFLEIHLGLMSYKNIFILNTTGESMEPTLKDGSLIFVNPIENEDGHVRDGGVYVIMCDNTILVKRVNVNPITKSYTLISDNPAHDNITIDMFHESGCKFVGRVVGSFDRV